VQAGHGKAKKANLSFCEEDRAQARSPRETTAKEREGNRQAETTCSQCKATIDQKAQRTEKKATRD
jgi:hypothetical protein